MHSTVIGPNPPFPKHDDCTIKLICSLIKKNMRGDQ